MVRKLLLAAVLLVVAAGTTLAVVLVVGWSNSKHDLAGSTEFTRPLAVPPLARSRVEDGRRVFDLRLQRGHHDFGRHRHVPTYGVNGGYLGPTVRVRDGEQVGFDVRNDLDEPTNLHWHGIHLPAVMDGGPHQVVEPGHTWRPQWQVRQQQGTFWYHPHLHGTTAEHVYRGLAGMLLVDPADPDAEARLGLPHRYGADDVPVVVQDRTLDGDRLDLSEGVFQSTGLLGSTIAVNGTVGPYLDVTTERVRLRLLNASNARVYTFHLDDDSRFAMVASDGGLLDRPLPLRRLTLSPGERAEVVVTMRPGDRRVLQSAPTPRLGTDALQQRWSGGDDSFDVLQLRAARHLAPSARVAHRLNDLPAATDDGVTTRRTFAMSGFSVNDRHMAMHRVDETVVEGRPELWTVRNDNPGPHSFHAHDVQFRVVSYAGHAPPPSLRGRKDTVLLPGHTEVTLRVRFDDYADPDHTYMFHCHLLRHEDLGMMGQFVVVEPGQHAGHVGHSTGGMS